MSMISLRNSIRNFILLHAVLGSSVGRRAVAKRHEKLAQWLFGYQKSCGVADVKDFVLGVMRAVAADIILHKRLESSIYDRHFSFLLERGRRRRARPLEDIFSVEGVNCSLISFLDSEDVEQLSVTCSFFHSLLGRQAALDARGWHSGALDDARVLLKRRSLSRFSWVGDVLPSSSICGGNRLTEIYVKCPQRGAQAKKMLSWLKSCSSKETLQLLTLISAADADQIMDNNTLVLPPRTRTGPSDRSVRPFQEQEDLVSSQPFPDESRSDTEDESVGRSQEPWRHFTKLPPAIDRARAGEGRTVLPELFFVELASYLAPDFLEKFYFPSLQVLVLHFYGRDTHFLPLVPCSAVFPRLRLVYFISDQEVCSAENQSLIRAWAHSFLRFNPGVSLFVLFQKLILIHTTAGAKTRAEPEASADCEESSGDGGVTDLVWGENSGNRTAELLLKFISRLAKSKAVSAKPSAAADSDYTTLPRGGSEAKRPAAAAATHGFAAPLAHFPEFFSTTLQLADRMDLWGCTSAVWSCAYLSRREKLLCKNAGPYVESLEEYTAWLLSYFYSGRAAVLPENRRPENDRHARKKSSRSPETGFWELTASLFGKIWTDQENSARARLQLVPGPSSETAPRQPEPNNTRQGKKRRIGQKDEMVRSSLASRITTFSQSLQHHWAGAACDAYRLYLFQQALCADETARGAVAAAWEETPSPLQTRGLGSGGTRLFDRVLHLLNTQDIAAAHPVVILGSKDEVYINTSYILGHKNGVLHKLGHGPAPDETKSSPSRRLHHSSAQGGPDMRYLFAGANTLALAAAQLLIKRIVTPDRPQRPFHQTRPALVISQHWEEVGRATARQPGVWATLLEALGLGRVLEALNTAEVDLPGPAAFDLVSRCPRLEVVFLDFQQLEFLHQSPNSTGAPPTPPVLEATKKINVRSLYIKNFSLSTSDLLGPACKRVFPGLASLALDFSPNTSWGEQNFARLITFLSNFKLVSLTISFPCSQYMEVERFCELENNTPESAEHAEKKEIIGLFSQLLLHGLVAKGREIPFHLHIGFNSTRWTASYNRHLRWDPQTKQLQRGLDYASRTPARPPPCEIYVGRVLSTIENTFDVPREHETAVAPSVEAPAAATGSKKFLSQRTTALCPLFNQPELAVFYQQATSPAGNTGGGLCGANSDLASMNLNHLCESKSLHS